MELCSHDNGRNLDPFHGGGSCALKLMGEWARLDECKGPERLVYLGVIISAAGLSLLGMIVGWMVSMLCLVQLMLERVKMYHLEGQ